MKNNNSQVAAITFFFLGGAKKWQPLDPNFFGGYQSLVSVRAFWGYTKIIDDKTMFNNITFVTVMFVFLVGYFVVGQNHLDLRNKDENSSNS